MPAIKLGKPATLHDRRPVRGALLLMAGWLVLLNTVDSRPAAAPAAVAGPTVRVSTVTELVRALETAEPGSTVLIADGHYGMPRYVEVTADDVTVRGASGDRDRVILDGADSRHRELLGIRRASGVTIADLTIQNVIANGIKINNDTPVHDVTIRNCVLRNIWQRGVKSVRSPELKTRNGLIEGCLFVNDRPKRFEDDPSDTAATFDGNYVGAIDLMDAVGWRIRDNVFRNIQGRTRVGRGAIFIWFESEDCVIERNLMVDCDQGIALGNAHKPADTPLHASRFLVRNNVIVRAPMNPLFLAHTRQLRILHNTLHDPDNPRRRSVRIHADNDGLLLAGNLIHGYPIALEGIVGDVTLEPNHVDQRKGGGFIDPGAGNLRLRPETLGELPRFRRLPDVPDDWDGVERPELTLPGAHHPRPD
jgi:hypothetical protein